MSNTLRGNAGVGAVETSTHLRPYYCSTSASCVPLRMSFLPSGSFR